MGAMTDAASSTVTSGPDTPIKGIPTVVNPTWPR
jgi:hypothetical protein